MRSNTRKFPLKPDEEARIISKLRKDAMMNREEGDIYYAISTKWFDSWVSYVGPSPVISERPGSIDNSDITVLMDDDPQVHRGMKEGPHYRLLPRLAWERLHEWYKGGQAIPRMVRAYGKSKLTVEVFLWCLTLIDYKDKTETRLNISGKVSLFGLYQTVCEMEYLDIEKVRLRDNFKNGQILISSEKTIEESMVGKDHEILVEVKVDGTWPFESDLYSTGNWSESSRFTFRDSDYTEGTQVESEGLDANEGTQVKSEGLDAIEGTQVGSEGLDAIDGAQVESEGLERLIGLENLGNTCYMNSTLQCLIHTPQLLDYFRNFNLEMDHDNLKLSSEQLSFAFGRLLIELSCSGHKYVVPVEFKDKLDLFANQFEGVEQHDSQEFLAVLLHGLHAYLKDEGTFYGQYKSTLSCLGCSRLSTKIETFMPLSLPLHYFEQPISLMSCLDEYLKEELLENEDMWDCPNCIQERKSTTKKLDLLSLPEILVFHLNRFHPNIHSRDKIDILVDFPIENLDLSKYVDCDDGSYYQLYAISNHIGKYVDDGHYTAYCKCNDDRWYEFDDTKVQLVHKSLVKSSAAYLLFYRRITKH